MLLPRSPRAAIQWCLFEPPFSSFQPNDLVFLLRPRSKLEQCYRRGQIESIDHDSKKARVELAQVATRTDCEKEVPGDESQQPHVAAAVVVVSVPFKRLIPIYSAPKHTAGTTVLVTANTQNYRNLALSQIQDNDDILELGCSTGETSVLLIAHPNVSWVGLDTSAEMIQLCTATLSQQAALTLAADQVGDSETSEPRRVHTFRVDALLHPLCALQQANRYHDQGPTVVFIDIGGNRDCTSILRIMAWCFTSFPRLRLAVIKSQELVQELQRAQSDGSLALDPSNGVMAGADDWFHDRIASLAHSTTAPSVVSRRRQSLHPLRAPLVMSPLDGTNPICRYHNYHPEGCKRRSEDCLLDHEHCHVCRQAGHTAKECTAR